MKIKAPQPLKFDLWREAKEAGHTIIFVEEAPDFELVFDSYTHLKGVKTIGPDASILTFIQQEIIKGLSEVNPLWSDENDSVPMFKKPKDLGTEKNGTHTVVTINLGDKIEQDRLWRNKSKLVRSIVQIYVTLKSESSDTI